MEIQSKVNVLKIKEPIPERAGNLLQGIQGFESFCVKPQLSVLPTYLRSGVDLVQESGPSPLVPRGGEFYLLAIFSVPTTHLGINVTKVCRVPLLHQLSPGSLLSREGPRPFCVSEETGLHAPGTSADSPWLVMKLVGEDSPSACCSVLGTSGIKCSFNEGKTSGL